MNTKSIEAFLTPELICSNIKTSLHFYTKILGFNIQYQREEEGFAMLERQGSHIMLDEIKDPAGKYRSWITAPLEAPFGRGINLQIKTTNVDTLYHHATAMGASIFLPIETKWYRGVGEKWNSQPRITQLYHSINAIELAKKTYG